MDILLHQALLPPGRQVDIGIDQGRIVAIEPTLPIQADQVIDLAGKLTLPAFVNGQLHACKSFWRRILMQLPAEVQTLPRFAAAVQVKKQYTAEDVEARVDETLRLAIQHGTCAIRLFADVDAASGLTALEALLRVRARYQPWLTVQVVAFPQDGFAEASSEQLMHQAMEMGADLVGGIPWIERDEAAQTRHVQRCFALAQDFNADLHFVCDDVLEPTCRSLEKVARQTLAAGYQGRVCATQCAALSAYDDTYASQVIQLVGQAGITIFSNSHVALIASDFDPTRHPWPRGITRVRQLIAAGVPVACGQDDIDNWFYPFGRNDMLEVAQFMAHNGQFAWNGEVNQVLPMITSTPAQAMHLANYGLQVGAEANLVVLDAQDWHQAIQFQSDKLYVLLKGKVAATTKRQTVLSL